MKYLIKTFGCQQNIADSETIASALIASKLKEVKSYKDANYIIINTCMVRRSAEDRIYGLVNNLVKIKNDKIKQGKIYKIVVTGCMVGLAYQDKTGQYLSHIKNLMPSVDAFIPITKMRDFIKCDLGNTKVDDFPRYRFDKNQAYVNISNGCNNFCTYCVVPFTRGREISYPYEKIIDECLTLKKQGYKKIMLLGQNVNSYGADLLVNKNKKYGKLKPIMVKHLGRFRIPTLFPHLLQEVAKMGFTEVSFMSSNPWDFSDELIKVIADNDNISRTIHLPVQSGDDKVLKRMNRWYTAKQYLTLISKIKKQIFTLSKVEGSNVKFTTDIIVGFCGETDKEFENTVSLCKSVGFSWVYIGIYSPRPLTAASSVMFDDVPHATKKKRWLVLENLINQPNLKNFVKIKE